MENAIVIIISSDIPAAVHIAKTLDSYIVYIFDATLEDQVAANGLSNIQLIHWNSCIPLSQLDVDARNMVFRLEDELTVHLPNPETFT